MLRTTGDLTGDGRADVAICFEFLGMRVLDGVTGAELWSVVPTAGSDGYRKIDTLDLDGDGRRELFYFRPQFLGPGVAGMTTVHDAATGTVRFTQVSAPNGGFGTSVAGLGDLDQDGLRDYVQWRSVAAALRYEASSGADGRRLWAQPSWSPTIVLELPVVGLGDVDGDGFGDFAHAADTWSSDSWHVFSGKIRAEATPQTGACGAGPFLPRLGATRPILGQTLTIAGQDAPLGTAGILALSLQPTAPTWLGANTCFAWFDLGSAIAIAAPTPPQWSLPLPLPLVPQLAGFELALQAWYAPTAGTLGFDLSNGVWLRLGWQ